MSPVNKHLTWIEIKDFSPGLVEIGDWLLPASAAQTCTDCYPQPGGGVRAFFKPSSLATTPIVTTTCRPIGFHSAAGPHRTLSTLANDYYIMVYPTTGDRKPALWRWDTTDSGETQWRLMKTFAQATADNDAPTSARFLTYKLTAGTVKIVVALDYVGSDAGVWTATLSDPASGGGAQTWTKITTTTGGPIAVHESRLLEARSSVIWFTGIGDTTIGVANFLDVEPAQDLPSIRLLLPSAPSDLLVGTAGGHWVLVSGSIASSPVTRVMSKAHVPGNRQGPAQTDMGIVFQEPDGGIFTTFEGASFNQLDTQLYPPASTTGTEVDMGNVAWLHDWLFIPRGYIFDMRTKSWFKASGMTTAKAYYLRADRFPDINAIFAPTSGSGWTIPVYIINERSGTRVNSMTWKSAPLRDSSGRQVAIREVQLYINVYIVNSCVSVTVGGVTKTISDLATGKQNVSFLFNVRDEVLDVQVDTNSNDASHEAPSFEVVRIGYSLAHQLR